MTIDGNKGKWIPLDVDIDNDTDKEPFCEKELFWEMANIAKRLHKELPANIWISAKNAKHGPRIKIQKNKGDSFQSGETFSMTISDTPQIVGDTGDVLTQKEIEYFVSFVIRNKDALKAYWDGTISTEEVLPMLVY